MNSTVQPIIYQELFIILNATAFKRKIDFFGNVEGLMVSKE